VLPISTRKEREMPAQGTSIFMEALARQEVLAILGPGYTLCSNEEGDEGVYQVWKDGQHVRLDPEQRDEVSRVKGVESIIP